MEKLINFWRAHYILSITVLSSILLSIYTNFVRMIAAGVLDNVLGDLYGLAVVAISIVMLIIHKIWFLPDYKGSFRWDLLKEKSIIIPVIVYMIIDIAVHGIGWFQAGVEIPAMGMLALALMAGFGEEISYRVIIMSNELRIWIRKGSYLPALIIGSVMFALSHAINVLAGASISATLLQVVGTFFAGIFMGAVYIRTANVIYPLIIHILHDYMSFMTVGATAVSTSATTFEEIAWTLGLIAVQVIISIWLLKGRKQEIISIWKERWSITD